MINRHYSRYERQVIVSGQLTKWNECHCNTPVVDMGYMVIFEWITSYPSPRVCKSRYWGEMLLSPIHCCDVTKPPYLLRGELCTSPLHSNRLFVFTVCYRRGGQCFSVLITRHTDVVGDNSGRSYVTEQGYNVPLLRTRVLVTGAENAGDLNVCCGVLIVMGKRYVWRHEFLCKT